MVRAVEATGEFVARAYGPSGTAPDDDPRAFELYFERLEEANPDANKRPDLLVFRREDMERVDALIMDLGGVGELPFTGEDDARMRDLVGLAKVAIECENSLWVASAMPAFGSPPTKQRRLGGRLGFAKSAVLPTVIVKEEDRQRLLAWQSGLGVPIHVWHSFFDRAYGIALDENERLIAEGLVQETIQVFQAPGGATSKKTIYKTPYIHAYPLAVSLESPSLKAAHIQDRNGHILPYVVFEGGELQLRAEALEVLRAL